MALSDEQARKYTSRLLKARMRLLCNHGFYGLLLMHLTFAVNEEHPTAFTNGSKITFSTNYLDNLSDRELDYVLLHEVMHIALQHCFRGKGLEPERHNLACDIVVNSNILLENNMDLNSITTRNEGVNKHLTPDGQEGYLFSAEDVYQMIKIPQSANSIPFPGSLKTGKNGTPKDKASEEDCEDDSFKDEEAEDEDETDAPEEENCEEDGEGKGKKPRREKGRAKKKARKALSQKKGWDDHEQWSETEESSDLQDVWVKRICDAAEVISIQESSGGRGRTPAFAKRLLEELKHPQMDWRTILNEFIQEEISDYSFSPPDRRFEDSPFFLPDFNEKEDTVENILFMVDTSGSMSDSMITAAFSEIKGAIDQFNGKLKGWLGFFDAAVIEPTPFETVDEFKIIRPAGGGGTDFQIIFEYVHRYMTENPPASIIILTDGYAPFPQEKLSNGIPVLWLLNNECAMPPWGKIARIKVL